jgi:hypothetical protein
MHAHPSPPLYASSGLIRWQGRASNRSVGANTCCHPPRPGSGRRWLNKCRQFETLVLKGDCSLGGSGCCRTFQLTRPYRYSPILPYPKVKRPVLAGQEIGCESFSSSSLYALLVELATASFLPRLLPGHVSWNAELGRLPRQYARNGEGQGLLGHGEKRPARTHAYPLPSCQTFLISTQVLKVTSPGS